ncbi:hypothetical protein BDZ88DRAFT_164198 [Geranomyces variabilis]|nr:hypothetical protein BDZ88DRAFT_164198 [Geranomyces variabilis]
MPDRGRRFLYARDNSQCWLAGAHVAPNAPIVHGGTWLSLRGRPATMVRFSCRRNPDPAAPRSRADLIFYLADHSRIHIVPTRDCAVYARTTTALGGVDWTLFGVDVEVRKQVRERHGLLIIVFIIMAHPVIVAPSATEWRSPPRQLLRTVVDNRRTANRAVHHPPRRTSLQARSLHPLVH